MDSQAKSVYQGTTVINPPPQGNPPPYSGVQQHGYPAPGPQVHYPPPAGAQYPHPAGAQYPPQTGVQYPPPTGVQYPHPAGVQAVVMGPSTVIIAQQMGPRPTHVTCKSCHAEVVTRVEANATTRTHLFALILCLVGCWPCVCIPYCMDDCMSSNHYCPNCNAYVGSYNN